MKKYLVLFLLISLMAGCKNKGDNSSMNSSSESKNPIITTQEKAINVYEDLYSLNSSKLPYRLYVPSDFSPNYEYPLFVFLHGAGERGKDNSLQLFHVIQDLFNDLSSPIYQSIVAVPQCPVGEQWVDTPWNLGNYSVDKIPESDELKGVISLIEGLSLTYNVNPNRIYVMGISMGGFGVWDLIMRHTEMFAAAIPICGGADITYAEKLKNMPIYTFHGDKDSSVPVDGTREMYNALIEAGSKVVTYEELAGYEHNVWTYAANKEGLIDWLFAQRKNKID